MKKVLGSLLVFCLTGVIFGQSVKSSLVVTKVEKLASGNYAITLNDVITIKDIKVTTTKIGQREIVNLKFPEYVSKRGKVFPQVSVVNKDLMDKMGLAISQNKIEKLSTPKEPSFKISKFSYYKRSKSSLRVFAAVVFDESIEIECKVMEGKRGPWISWPAKKDTSTGKYIKQVLFNSKELQNRVEQQLIEKYNISKQSGSSTSYSNDEE